MLILRQPLHLGRKIEIGLGPPRIVCPEIAVFTFQLLENRRAARTLSTIDIETSADREVIVHRFKPFPVCISMKHGDLHPREKVGDISHGREDGNRVEQHDFLHGFQLQLILAEQYRTLRIDEPGCLVAPSANLIFQWTKDRIGIRQCCKKRYLFIFRF